MKDYTQFRIFLAIFFLLVLSFSGFSQRYNFRNYSVEEGLAQSQVYAMCEDINGNIWFGTRGGGLSRFDGINFTNYTVQEGLSSNYIRTIIKDKTGNLWVGTDNGLSKYDGRKFVNYTAEQGLYNEVVNALTEDMQGTIWVGTDKGIFHVQKDTVVRFGRKINIPQEKVNCLQSDNNGNVLAGTDFGLYEFEQQNHNWSMKHYTAEDGLAKAVITYIAPPQNNRLWICTYDKGVIQKEENHFINPLNKEKGLSGNTIFACLPEKDGTVWFGTASGLCKYQSDSSIVNYTETEGLANNVVMCILKDSFGNVWFGTSGGGVSKLDSERFIHYTAIKGVFGNWVYSIAQDKEGNMWFGTSEGGVTRYDGKYYKRFSEKDGFTASKVKYIHEDKSGNLWMGTIADGVYLYNGKIFRHFNSKNGLSSNFINYIVSDTSGRIWLATAGGGINYLTPLGNRYKINYIKPKDGLGSDRVHTLVLDFKGNLWAGCANGIISKISFIEDHFSITNYNRKKQSGNSIRCSAIDSSGNLYFGTADEGVLVYNEKPEAIWTKQQGLASNNTYSLIFDSHHNLWVGTEKGIDKVSFDRKFNIKEVRHYGKPEGFFGIEAIQNSVCRDKNGNIWFGSLKAATVFNPDKERSLQLPKVHITGISLFFDKIEQTPYGKQLSAWYPLPQQLILPYNQNHLSFEFTGIEQSNPEAVHYKWKLEGFDKEWSPVTSRREAVYSNLPPGEYTFKVMAANEVNQWSKVPAVYSFTIQPPFWKTWWFNLIAIIVFIASVWGMISFSFRKVKEKNEREKQKLETERTLIELEQKALRLQMNPHFLFNCLNSIKGLIAENKQEDAKLYLTKFARLMRFILDNSMEESITLEEEIKGLYNYAELEKLSNEGAFDFSVHADKVNDPSFVKIPPMLIQPFVENAIIHGIAPKEGKGIITVNFVPEGRYLKCTIEDNGIGREKARQFKQESMHQHKSAAIAVTQERLSILNKKRNLEEVKIVITDLKDESNNNQGTRVELMIPFQEI